MRKIGLNGFIKSINEVRCTKPSNFSDQPLYIVDIDKIDSSITTGNDESTKSQNPINAGLILGILAVTVVIGLFACKIFINQRNVAASQNNQNNGEMGTRYD